MWAGFIWYAVKQIGIGPIQLGCWSNLGYDKESDQWHVSVPK